MERLFGTWAAGEEERGEEERQSPDCGGTAHILPMERKKATFDVGQLTTFIDGGEEWTAKKRWVWSVADDFDNSSNIFLTREEQVRENGGEGDELRDFCAGC